jgi:NADH dehydrogenase/NADH:ubiquinone oxidoreductase subunit G
MSHPAMSVNLDACIQCNRCVRACREEQVNDVIGYAFRGDHSKIVFDFDDPMGASTCVACGECVQACPTGALMPAREVGKVEPDRQVDSVCPYCGVGCQLTYNIKGNTILYVQGKDGPANSSRLCVKGRYGFDYVQHKHRLTKPLIRKDGVPKHKDFVVDPDRWHEVFREATWEEAMDFAATGLTKIRDTYGKRALAGFGSAKGTNEEAYLFQKLVRTGFGCNNVDHCTRLCHASSVAALMEGINSGAVSNQVRDVANAEVIFVIGANPTVNHPVAATFIKNAAKAGVKLIVADPRKGDLARHATYNLQFNAGHGRSAPQRDAERHRGRRAGRRGVHRRSHVGLRGAGQERQEVHARGDGAHLRHRRQDHPRRGAALCHVEGVDDPVGHGHLAARARHRQRALPDRAGALHRPDRQARLGAAPAARPEQRAGRERLGPDPDVLSRLSARERARSAAAVRDALEDAARSGSGPHRGRDHDRREEARDPRHVHHG